MNSLALTVLTLVTTVARPDGDEAVVDAARFPSLQQAADAIPESGGVLRIPPGRYELSKPLRIRTGDTRIEGAGTATHLINRNEQGQPAILLENQQFRGRSVPADERLWRISICDLRVTGNPQSGAGIEAHYIEELVVEGVTSSYHGGDGLRMVMCYEDPRISDNLFTYNKACGVYLEGCHDIIVSANQFEENQDGLQCIDSFNLTMSGNNLDDHLGDGVVIENTYGSVVASNMIEECQGWAIVLDRDCYGITLSANVIAHEFSGGIDLRDAHGCAVSANTFTIVKKTALAIRADSGSITITGNNFSDSRIGYDENERPQTKRPSAGSANEANPNEATGILLDGCRGAVIVGNIFSGLSGKPILQADGCEKIVIEDNGTLP
jgi:parallel beta-helix repeat protein